MSEPANVDRVIAAWLEAGPARPPDEALEAIVLAARTTPQERGARAYASTFRWLGVAAAAALAVGLFMVLRDPPPNTAGPAPGPSGTPSPTAAPTPSGTPSPTLAPTATIAQDPAAVLAARLPAALAARCAAGSLADGLAAAGLEKEPPVGSDRLYDQQGRQIGTRRVVELVEKPTAVLACASAAAESPTSIWVVRFPPADSGSEPSADLVIAMPGSLFDLPIGDCGTAGPATGSWGPGTAKVACRIGADGAWIYWTYGTPEQLLLFAHRADGDLDALRAWWVANRESLIRPG